MKQVGGKYYGDELWFAHARRMEEGAVYISAKIGNADAATHGLYWEVIDENYASIVWIEKEDGEREKEDCNRIVNSKDD